MSLPWIDFFRETTSMSNSFWMRSSITVFTGLQLIFKQSTLTILKNSNGYIVTFKNQVEQKSLITVLQSFCVIHLKHKSKLLLWFLSTFRFNLVKPLLKLSIRQFHYDTMFKCQIFKKQHNISINKIYLKLYKVCALQYIMQLFKHFLKR